MDTYRLHKKWLFRLAPFVVALMALMGTFNYAIDPLWCFSHANRFNAYQRVIDERMQKSNYLLSRKPDYTALILGNSRTAQINQNCFTGVKAFNYAVSAMSPLEYKQYLQFFGRVAGIPKLIVLGCDFSNSNSKEYLIPESKLSEYYFSRASSSLSHYSTLLLNDTFRHSINNLRLKHSIEANRQNTQVAVYDRNNVASIIKFRNAEDIRLNREKQVAATALLYRTQYAYRCDLKRLMMDFRDSGRGAKMIVFTTPVSEPYFCAMVREKKLPEYERWLKELVDVFGEVWHFEYIHTVARNYENTFSDSSHFFPWIGTLIAHRVTGVQDPLLPADFGMLLDRTNIGERLGELRRNSLASCGG